LFFNSQSEPEKNHLIDALIFELGKVKTVAIRERMLGMLKQIDGGLASQVAYGLGLEVPQDIAKPINHSVPADGRPEEYEPIQVEGAIKVSKALSMANTIKNTIQSRKIAILVADGVNADSVQTLKAELEAQGAITELIAPRLGKVMTTGDAVLEADQSFLTAASVLFDAVYVAGGTNAVATLEAEANAVHFLNEAFKHCKAIAADEDAMQVLEATYFHKKLPEDFSEETVLKEGIVISGDPSKLAKLFAKAIAQHRFWEREKPRLIPA
jgi:catalase